jgi:two-component system chemotaxis response regulator CheB
MRILLAETDLAYRASLRDKFAADPGLRLMEEAGDLSAAYHAAEHRPPHLAIVGASLARRPEFEVMGLLLRALSVRCLVLHRGADGRGRAQDTAGRLGFGTVDGDLPATAFCAAIRAGFGGRPSTTAAMPLGGGTGGFRPGRAILIGASTGGVDALLKVLSAFPADCPPTLIVQHTGAGFSAGLARLLNNCVAPEVAEARDGEPLVPGRVLIAPGSDRHLVLTRRRDLACGLREGPPVSGHRPSVDALLLSALPEAARVSAALLTGMGRDGAEGLTRLRQAGCRTIGQDAATSVVYGMPKAARDMGGVAMELPIAAIGAALLDQCRLQTQVQVQGT